MDWALQVAAFPVGSILNRFLHFRRHCGGCLLAVAAIFFDAPDALMDVGFTAFCEVLLPCFFGSLGRCLLSFFVINL